MYVAGFFDGEGCVCIDSFRARGCTTRNSHRFRITFTNTNRPVLDAIAERWPGGQMRLVTKGKTSTRDCYQLSYSSRNAEPLLRAIIPWLRVKKKEAQFALEFLRTIMSPNRGRAGLPEGVWEKRQGLMEGLRASRGYPRP